MSDSIIIRKAKQDYVCSCCGHIIHKGDEYLDKVILNVGKIVKHDRYHDECPHQSALIKLFMRLEQSNGDIPAAASGDKCHVIGIKWLKEEPHILVRAWTGTVVLPLTLEAAGNLIDEKGDPIL